MHKIKIPKLFQERYGKSELLSKNTLAIWSFFNSILDDGLKPYRFIPAFGREILFYNIKKDVQERLVENNIVLALLPDLQRALFYRSSDVFNNNIKSKFEEIKKAKEFIKISHFFLLNEKELKKELNIPEDDDKSILQALVNLTLSQDKFILSDDEHFWKYSSEIETEFKVKVIKEDEVKSFKF